MDDKEAAAFIIWMGLGDLCNNKNGGDVRLANAKVAISALTFHLKSQQRFASQTLILPQRSGLSDQASRFWLVRLSIRLSRTIEFRIQVMIGMIIPMTLGTFGF
ncbi:hypothetical protein FF1_013887 [Malus domestica]